MNHISKGFASSDGRVYKCHSWELREGGYRRVALLLGNGLWPAAEETRLVRFLLDRGFRVLALDVAFGSTSVPRVGLRAFRQAVASFARAYETPGMPLYLLASSFSAGAILPAAASLTGLAALALLAPVVDFPPPKLKKSFFFMPSAELAIKGGDLCGEDSLAEGLLSGAASMRFRKRDLKAAAADLDSALAEGVAFPCAAFSGDDDPFIAQEGRSSLARAGVKLYGYPRVRHEPGRDRYADNYYADLGAFLDEVEAKGAKAKGGL
jgi:alpha-beta hydrolase superfamily lysophospholipase